ncbi:MAG TPA: large conductance mechanosensitive channel protein MscL [Gaiellaceae bacterium]|nr:large conductance mechanosensitive channel protein MscL [Gaiellaceae bacterium]
MLREFKDFLLKGNLIEVAVALVLALALTAVVTSLVEDLITPLIAAVFGQPDFSGLTFEINESVFRYGEFLNALIAFVLIAAVLFFLVVKPVNAVLERRRRGESPTVRECPECLSEIPAGARRCPFCTAEVGAAS